MKKGIDRMACVASGFWPFGHALNEIWPDRIGPVMEIANGWSGSGA
jgi:hypothetical protein